MRRYRVGSEMSRYVQRITSYVRDLWMEAVVRMVEVVGSAVVTPARPAVLQLSHAIYWAILPVQSMKEVHDEKKNPTNDVLTIDRWLLPSKLRLCPK
jgi:hypothetical protein